MNIALSLGKPIRARRRFTPGHALHLLVIHGAFAALIVASIVYTREPPAVPQSVSLTGLGGVAGAGGAGPGFAIGASADDPVVRFSQTRIGHILYAPYVGDHCRRVLFDNGSGALLEAGPRLCVRSAPEQASTSGADRLLSMRKTFQK